MSPPVRKILAMFFALEEQMKNVRSLTGKHLEHLKEGFSHLGLNQNPSESLQVLYLDISVLLRNLTNDERDVCKLRYGTDGELTTYQKLVPTDHLHRIAYDDGTCELITKQGETLITTDPQTGHSLVIGWKRKCLTYRQISDILRIPHREIREIDKSACNKIRAAYNLRNI